MKWTCCHLNFFQFLFTVICDKSLTALSFILPSTGEKLCYAAHFLHRILLHETDTFIQEYTHTHFYHSYYNIIYEGENTAMSLFFPIFTP
jgi:hypothetical protein